MQSDESLENGLSALRKARPGRGIDALMAASRRRERRAKAQRAYVGAATCLVALGFLAIALRPTPALASLKEYAHISDSQPSMHFYSTHPARADQIPVRHDIWLLPDKLIRKFGHELTITHPDGVRLSYDDRYPTGYRDRCDDWETDYFRSPITGTMADVFNRMKQLHYSPVKVDNVEAHGGRYTDFRAQKNCFGDVITDNIYVDPESKLIRFEDQEKVSPSGDRSITTTTAEYPPTSLAEKLAPKFPKGLKFLTRPELTARFLREIPIPSQTRVVLGIPVTFYGVVLQPDGWHDGLRLSVITRGGAGADRMSDHFVKITAGPLATVKATDGLSPNSHILPSGHQKMYQCEGELVAGDLELNGAKYHIDVSDQLLSRVPTRITVRVPVWRSDLSQTYISHWMNEVDAFHPSVLVGYATFTTSKIYYGGADESWSLFGDGDRGPVGRTG